MGDKTLTDIQKILNLPDPLLAFKWVAKYLPFDLPPEYMAAIELPFNNISISEGQHVGARFIYHPGTHTVSSVSATFYEDRKGTSSSWLNYWKSQVKDFESGAYRLPSRYKRNIIVSLLDQKNDVVITAKLIGCWPADTNPFSLNYTDGSGRITNQQTFSVDNVQYSFPKSPR